MNKCINNVKKMAHVRRLAFPKNVYIRKITCNDVYAQHYDFIFETNIMVDKEENQKMNEDVYMIPKKEIGKISKDKLMEIEHYCMICSIGW